MNKLIETIAGVFIYFFFFIGLLPELFLKECKGCFIYIYIYIYISYEFLNYH